MKLTNGKPLMAFGMVLILGIMIGAMIVLAIMPNNINIWESGMWSIMAIPSFGFVLMLVIMFFFFRKMTGQGGLMSGIMGQKQKLQPNSKESTLTTLTYLIPAISCGHCKMTIEKKVGELPGVASVNVDLEFVPPSHVD